MVPIYSVGHTTAQLPYLHIRKVIPTRLIIMQVKHWILSIVTLILLAFSVSAADPTVSSVKILPNESVYTNYTLTGYCTGDDADNDTVKYEIIWFRNDTQWATGFLVNNTYSTYQETADSITANQAELYDGNWSSAGSGYESIEENYTLPFYGVGFTWIRGGVSLNWSYQDIDSCMYAYPDKISFLASTTDQFGGSRGEYCWNGTTWQALLTNTFYERISETAIYWEEYPAPKDQGVEQQVSKVMAHNTQRYENWTLSCRVDDGTANSSWSNSSTVYILDAPPSTLSASISPAGTANTTQDLVGYCNSSDIDGDLVHYEYNWTKNGVSFQTGILYNISSSVNYNVANITSNETTALDTWILYCRAISSIDGTANGSWVASSATNITNEGPVVTWSQPTDGQDISQNSFQLIANISDANSNVGEVNITIFAPNGSIFYSNQSGSINVSNHQISMNISGLQAFGRYIINISSKDTLGDGSSWSSRGIDYITPYITWYDDFENADYLSESWSEINWVGVIDGGIYETGGYIYSAQGGNGANIWQNFSQTKGLKFDKDFSLRFNFSKGFPAITPPKDIWLVMFDGASIFSTTNYIFIGLAVDVVSNSDLRIFCGGSCSCADVSADGGIYDGRIYVANITYNYSTGLMNYSRVDSNGTNPVFVNSSISGCDFSEWNTGFYFRQGDVAAAGDSKVYDFWVGTVCHPNLTCTLYGSCVGHNQACLNATDSNSCGAIPNLTLYDAFCNSLPVLNVSVNDTSLVFNDSVRCNIGYSDADGDNVTYQYQWAADGLNISTGTSQDLIITNVTWYNVTCYGRANDSYNLSSWTPSANNAIVVNTPPTISNVQLGPSPAYASSTITCNWTYYDVNLDPENASIIRWFVDNSQVSQVTYSGSYPSLSNSYYSGGDNVTCAVLGFDGVSYSSAYVNNSLVVSNSAPSLTSAALTPSTAYKSSVLTCTAVGATDIDGDSLTKYYQFRDSDNISILQSYSTNNTFSCNANASCNRGDTIYCSVVVSDGQLNSSSRSDARNITNAPPIAREVYISPYLADDNDTLECNYTYYDADGDAESSVQYRWFLNGSVQGNTLKTLNSGLTSDFDKWSCEVKVNDGFTDGAPVNSTQIYVGANNPHNIIITDNGIVDETAGTITFYWTWIDPQIPSGGPYTHYVCNTSNINGSGCQSGTQLCMVTDDISPSQCTYTIPANTPRNNTAYWLIKDGSGLESLITQHEWVYNRRPTATNISINVTSNGLYNTYTCLLSGVSDQDGDELLTTYAFFASNGTTLQSYSGTNTYIVNSGAGTTGNNIVCRARAYDDRIYSVEYNGTSTFRVASISYPSSSVVDTFLTISATLSNYSNITGVNLTIRDPYYVQFSDIPMVYSNATGKWAYSFAPNIVGQWIVNKVYAVDENGQSYVFKGSGDSFTVTTSQGGGGGGGGGETTIREIPVIGNITGFCGDGVCQQGENPSNCWSDCRVNYDTLVACIFDEEIECNWEQSWFPLALIGFLGVITVISLFISSNRQKRRGTK
jgi:hypothetical protein